MGSRNVIVAGLLLLQVLLIGGLTAEVQAAVPPQARDHRTPTEEDVQWRVSSARGGIDVLTFHNLINEHHDGYLTYGSRRYGINLVWETKKPLFDGNVFFFENCTRPGDPIYGSDRVAIRVSRGPSNVAYLSYGRRANGVNLVWAEKRACEFRLVNLRGTRFAATAAIDGTFAIYNVRHRAFLVYGRRSRGINLKWRSADPPGGGEAKVDLVPIRLRWVGNQAVVTIENQGNVSSTRARQELRLSVAGRAFTVVMPTYDPLAPGESKWFVYALSGLVVEDCELVTVEVDLEKVFQSGSGVFANDRVRLRANDSRACRREVFLLRQGELPTTQYRQMTDVTIAQALPDMPLADPERCYADGDDPPGSGKDLLTLLRWDLSQIPRESRVTAAAITLDIVNESQHTYAFFGLWKPWREDSANWRQAQSGRPWSQEGLRAGADYDARSLGELRPRAKGTATVALNSAGVETVQSWVQERETNLGVVLMNSTATDGVDFHCREIGQADARPRLTVYYTVSGRRYARIVRAQADVSIAQALPDVSLGNRAACYVDGDDPPGTRTDLATLLRWDLSGLPRGRSVKSAQIVLHVTNPSNDTYYLYAARRGWSERVASWLQATDSRRWNRAGADYNGTVLGQLTASETGRAVLTLNRAGRAVVASWIEQPGTNDGFVLANPTAIDGLDFQCSESGDSRVRPLLSVELE